MAAAVITVDLREIRNLAKRLDDAALDPSARSELLAGAASILEAGSFKRFSTKEDPEGKRWEDIAEKTRKRYESKGLPARPPLVLSGILRKSLRSEVAADAHSAMVGATMTYAAVHQFGWPEKNIPARPYLGMSKADARDVTDAVADYMARRFA